MWKNCFCCVEIELEALNRRGACYIGVLPLLKGVRVSALFLVAAKQ